MKNFLCPFLLFLFLAGNSTAQQKITNDQLVKKSLRIADNRLAWIDEYGISFAINDSIDKKILHSGYSISDLFLDGNEAVWSNELDRDIYYYNGDSARQIIIEGPNIVDSRPFIKNSKIFWQRGNTSYFFNGSTIKEIGKDALVRPLFSITGDSALWMTYYGGSRSEFRILFYDGLNAITLARWVDANLPAFFKKGIVWLENGFVKYYDYKTIVNLTGGTISGVLFSDSSFAWKEKQSELFYYNVASKKISQITDGSSTEEKMLMLENSRVVYEAKVGNKYEIFMYDGKVNTKVSNDNYVPGDLLALNDSVIAWKNSISGKNIFYYDLQQVIEIPTIKEITMAQAFGKNLYYIDNNEIYKFNTNIEFQAVGYSFVNDSIGCQGKKFCLPIIINKNISQGVNGYRFTITYDPKIVTPTGKASLGSILSSYGSYIISNNVEGELNIVLYLNGAPDSVFFSGRGMMVCVEFELTGNPNLTNENESTALFKFKSIFEETPASTTSFNSTAEGKIVFLKERASYGQLFYQNSMQTIGLDTLKPDEYNTTKIIGMDSTCTIKSGYETNPDKQGMFRFTKHMGNKIQLVRDVAGDYYSPDTSCADVMPVINSTDRYMALMVASGKVTPGQYFLAADVNLDGRVNAADVSLISSRTINGAHCEFPQKNFTWNGTAYVPGENYKKSKDWVFKTTIPGAIFDCIEIPTNKYYWACDNSGATRYEAILLGDVNGNWRRNKNGAQLRIAADDAISFSIQPDASNSRRFNINLSFASAADTVYGIDLSFRYDPKKIQISSVAASDAAGDADIQWNQSGSNKIMLSCFDINGLPKQNPVLSFTAISDNILEAAASFLVDGYINGEAVHFVNDALTSNDRQLSSASALQVYPNPFVNAVTIQTNLTGKLEVEIIDVYGKVVKKMVFTGSGVQNIDTSLLEGGVYFFKNTSDSFVEIVKVSKY